MDDKFDVFPCTSSSLRTVISEKSEVSTADLNNKKHIQYFEGYFQEIGANTLVVENDYVDHDYTEDHSEYYVRCFKGYNRKCTRLHLFRNNFTIEEFEGFLTGDRDCLSSELLQENYLGFLVVKPLPKTVIGRTCLKTYPNQDSRHFPITRAYSVNLFGIDLTVDQSLAFQEQDTVVAACATSALWSVFQGTGKLFQHAIPSPSVITKAATEHITDGERTRAFPSKGLDVIEMARAIKGVGLEPYYFGLSSNEYLLKSTAYAYLRMCIPMILGFPLFDTAVNPNESMGKHAVALAGYNLSNVSPVVYGHGFKLLASRIDKLYVHDDQVGPFAKMMFDGVPIQLAQNGNIHNFPSLSTSWDGSDGITGSARAVPELLLIPLYHKIRIPFSCIHDQIMELDSLILAVLSITPEVCSDTALYEWDIYLTTVSDVKSELLEDKNLDPSHRKDILLSGFPKYIWRATVVCEGVKIFDFLFDATDLEQSSFLINVFSYQQKFSENLRQMLKDPVVEKTFLKSKAWSIVEWLKGNF